MAAKTWKRKHVDPVGERKASRNAFISDRRDSERGNCNKEKRDTARDEAGNSLIRIYGQLAVETHRFKAHELTAAVAVAVGRAEARRRWNDAISEVPTTPRKVNAIAGAITPNLEPSALARTGDLSDDRRRSPKAVANFVKQTLADSVSWFPAKSRAALEKAMIRGIEWNAMDRAETFAHWVALSESFVDVRVYEGPRHDKTTDTIYGT